MGRLLIPGRGFQGRTPRLWHRAGEVPSFHIAPARTGHARDLITGSVLGTYDCARPAWAVGPDGILFQPAANAPVIEYDPVTRACLGARIWGVVTNRLPNSASIGAPISSGTTNGPNNEVMRKAVPPAGLQSFPSIGQGIEAPFSLSSGQTVDVAIGGWFAAGPSGMAIEPRLIVDFFTSPSSNRIYAELQINTSNWTVRSKGFGAGVTEASAPVITQYSPILFPGVYRVDWVVRYTQGATARDRTSSYVQLRDSTGSGTYTADGIGHFQFFGLQSTLSSTPQPYVPTTTTAASSTSDVWPITGADFSRIWNQSAVTMYADVVMASAASASNQFIARASDNTYNNQISLGLESGGYPQFTTASGGTFDGAGSSTIITANTAFKLAAASQLNDLALSHSSSIFTDSSANTPASLTRLDIGSDHLGLNRVVGMYLREFAILRSRRPNTNLQAMAF